MRTSSRYRRVARRSLLLAVVACVLPLAPWSTTAAAAASCPSNAICLYNNIRFGSPQVPYQPLGVSQNITPRDAVSSWQNTSGRTYCAYDRRTGRPDQFLFVISARDQDDWVGSPVNDRADFFKPC